MIVHPVFSSPAIERIKELKKNSFLGRLIVCDTIDTQEISEELDFLEVIHSAKQSAKIIVGISQNQQMADLIDVFSPKAYLEYKEKN